MSGGVLMGAGVYLELVVEVVRFVVYVLGAVILWRIWRKG